MSQPHGRQGKRRSSDRQVDRLNPAQTFLIVCEGEQTEPNYFRAFRVPTEVCQVDVVGAGCNTVSLVEQAIELARGKHYDQVWCVFDRDSFSLGIFNAALDLARNQGFFVAYSNESFELWYLLHFDYCDTGISRQRYCELLEEKLKRKYRKNDREIYAALRSRQPNAIRNARKLLAQYDPCDPGRDNPSTTVFRLVEELNQYLPENRLKAL